MEWKQQVRPLSTFSTASVYDPVSSLPPLLLLFSSSLSCSIWRETPGYTTPLSVHVPPEHLKDIVRTIVYQIYLKLCLYTHVFSSFKSCLYNYGGKFLRMRSRNNSSGRAAQQKSSWSRNLAFNLLGNESLRRFILPLGSLHNCSKANACQHLLGLQAAVKTPEANLRVQ